jgi:uncharacterized protein (TIGR03437 family)
MLVLIRFLFAFLVALPLIVAQPVNLGGPTVRISTTLGDIDVVLASNFAPRTVTNFLTYVNQGAYNGTIIHRSVSNFVIQTGGFKFENGQPVAIPADRPVFNEFRISNTRGTLAMAKFEGDPNSATNQFFFNLANNSGNLDNQNGGFTAFAWIPDTGPGRALMDQIAAVPIPSPHPLASINGGEFSTMPLRNFTSGSVTDANVIKINSITVLDGPVISSDGVVAASAFGGYRFGAPGAFMEIYGANLAGNTRSWATTDFAGPLAPTTLSAISATVAGQRAFVQYISPNQVNIQIPENVPTSGEVPVIINRGGAVTTSFNLPMQQFAAGLLAPASFKVGDRQFVAAVKPNGQFAGNGNLEGITTSPAQKGETLVIYGAGFGPVTPDGTRFAGRIPSGVSQIQAQVEIKIGDQVAPVSYAGLAPGLVGIYQFNVQVPENAPSGDLPLTVSVNGVATGQSLFLPVR